MVIKKRELIERIDEHLIAYDRLKQINFLAAIEHLKCAGKLARLMEEEDGFFVRERSNETH